MSIKKNQPANAENATPGMVRGCMDGSQAPQSSQAEWVHTDNVGNGVSGRVRPDEIHRVDRYRRHTGPFCWKISFFP